MKINEFENYLYACRFCTMCKPFGEVSCVTKDETHSTRIRAMLLWRVATGKAPWDANISQVVYQCSLNTVNQAWCLDRVPVPRYILAAREDLCQAGFAPDVVKDYSIPSGDSIAEKLAPYTNPRAEVLLYPGDALAAGDPDSAISALKLISKLGISAGLPGKLFDSGGLAYCLGRTDLLREQASQVLGSFEGATLVIVDGPLSMWALSTVYSSLGVPLPPNIQFSLLTDWLIEQRLNTRLSFPEMPERVYLVGSEFSRLLKDGVGSYESFRKLIETVPGLVLIEPVDRLELAHSSGAGGGLHLVNSDLALAVSRQRVEEALQANACWLVTDSPLDAAQLKLASPAQLCVLTVTEFLENATPT